MLLLSPNHLSVSHQAEHTDAGWYAGCYFVLFQTFKLLPKALTVTYQGATPCLCLFCGNTVV